ncbi:putative ligase [Medicago truncatula]|uniref:Putative ligase n=1 Tax=Medicago truncatula TaxID=3880 RepID=A0A396INX2_MEDTR|nr:putative ligase [Medicago truncatula]
MIIKQIINTLHTNLMKCNHVTTQFDCSYDRLLLTTWGSYLFWGNENRNAPLRACSPGIPSGLVSNFEFKPFDGTANPYLGLSATVAAGIDGLCNTPNFIFN